jgi:NAD(P)-dependent dehydrogenase (short-subunit alcohol dehydrogenase family)
MKNYFIVGGSSGIGKALAHQLAEEGNMVYSTYNSTEVESVFPGLTYEPLNVLDTEYDLDFLPDTIDGFAYCPGSINLAPFKRIKPEDFVKDYELQVTGFVRLLQHLLPRFKNAENPSVVLFSTVAVQRGFNFHSQVAASKGAIEGLTRSLAAEYAPKIRFNAVAPSLTDTPLAERLLNKEEKKQANAERHPLKRIGEAEDIAQMARFLLSDASSWMTGQILHVDGGKSAVEL